MQGGGSNNDKKPREKTSQSPSTTLLDNTAKDGLPNPSQEDNNLSSQSEEKSINPPLQDNKLLITTEGERARITIKERSNNMDSNFKYPVVFVDMKERDEKERKRLRDRKFELEQAKKKEPNKQLSPALQNELSNINRKLRYNKVFDPLYIVTRNLLCKISRQYVNDHSEGKLPSQTNLSKKQLEPMEKTLAAVYGILVLDNHTNPDDLRFAKMVSLAQGEYTANQEFFEKVLEVLIEEGEVDIEGSKKPSKIEYHVREKYWVAVTRILKSEGVRDELLPLRARAALAKVDGAMDGAPASSLCINLPDLEEHADIEIVVDNLHATQALYFAASLEELKFFQVVDKLVELFQNGYLPLGKGPAGDYLYCYWKESQNRLTEIERRSLYARVFGFPGGDAMQGSPNREFDTLWLRFVSAVSSYVRQINIDDLLRAPIPYAVSQEQVKRSGRDLAANLSLHGYGIAWFAATELQKQINDIIKLLSDQEIKLAFGARDMWQVIDQVATMELGGAKNSIRYRTMANSGAIIVRWLATHAKKLAGSLSNNILNLSEIQNPLPRSEGSKPTVDPTDFDLVNACEQWLAVNGIPEREVETYSQPSEPPMITSRPIQIPSVAKDLLESVGVQASAANNKGSSYGYK